MAAEIVVCLQGLIDVQAAVRSKAEAQLQQYESQPGK